MANRVLDTVMTIYIKTMAEDDDKEVIAQVWQTLSGILDTWQLSPKVPRPPQDRTMIVMPLVVKELVSSDATNRRNAAFCAGEFCKNGGHAALKYYGDVMRGLYPLFGESEPNDVVRDNAAGVVVRMIML